MGNSPHSRRNKSARNRSLVTAKSALRVAYLTAILVFLSGIPGTAHHYFWYGGPSFWLAIGGVFSSLEPISLILLVVPAWMEHRSIRAEGKEFPYRWPLYFLMASSVWNFVGAGMFGFLINLPIVNYYEHATYLTANHEPRGVVRRVWNAGYCAHIVLMAGFGGKQVLERSHPDVELLGVERGAVPHVRYRTIADRSASGVDQLRPRILVRGSAAFYEMELVQKLGNWRIVPDTIIIVLGAFPLLYFLLSTYPRLRNVGESGTKMES